MDDPLIYSQTKEEHLIHLELVFEKFRDTGIKLKMSKCLFLGTKRIFRTPSVWPRNILYETEN